MGGLNSKCPPCICDENGNQITVDNSQNVNENNNSSTSGDISRDINQSQTNSFENNVLGFHNILRKENGLQSLEWDNKLAKRALEWGDFLKENENCVIRHPINSQKERDTYIPNGNGQNLYSSFGFPNNTFNPQIGIQKMYDECNLYQRPEEGQSRPNNFLGVGHFTQLIWKDTKKVGCARIECNQNLRDNNNNIVNGKGGMLVCNYDKGNIDGQFREQVQKDFRCEKENKWIN